MAEEKRTIGVRFQRAGRVFYHDPGQLTLEVGEGVVAQTKHGLRVGTVVISPAQVLASDLNDPLPSVVRKATPEDLEQWDRVAKKAGEALTKGKELVAKYGLDMKILHAEANLPGDHYVLYFTAPEKVDFRKLARELASHLKAKVEIRQIGPRDATKIVGGLGRCGAPICCATFLTEFNPVSVKMAKEQHVSLDPLKNSGACGRLLCCLGYESQYYHEISKRVPKKGHRVQTSSGEGKVIGANILKESVMVQLENNTVVEVPLSELKE